MKSFLIILLTLSIASCSPFISKDLRKKNKCNRQLKKVVEKCPQLLTSTDTLIQFDTTVITKGVKVDTVFSLNFDTLEIIRNKFHLKLIKLTDTLIVNGGCESDTIYIDKVIRVPTQTIKPVQLTIFEQVLNGLGRFWWWLVVAIILFFAYKILSKRFF